MFEKIRCEYYIQGVVRNIPLRRAVLFQKIDITINTHTPIRIQIHRKLLSPLNVINEFPPTRSKIQYNLIFSYSPLKKLVYQNLPNGISILSHFRET